MKNGFHSDNCATNICSTAGLRFTACDCGAAETLKKSCGAEVQAVQAREYPPLPWGNQQPYVWFCRTKDTDLVAAFRAYVDADRASSGATTQAVRMLTPREIELLREIRLHAQFGLNEGWQREARNLLLELEQYYRTIPPSGVIGGV